MVNLWSNSTFETSTDPWIAQSGSDTPVLSEDQAHGGDSSLHCARGAGTSNLYARARIDTSLFVAGTYALDLWLYVPADVAGTNGIRLTGSGTTTLTLTTDVLDEWVPISTSFDWDGLGTLYLYPYGTDQGARCYLDDLTIDDGTMPPGPAPGAGLGCTVYTVPAGSSNLVRLADGAPTDNPFAPTVLSDLKVSWGRDNTIDQPASSTCSFTLLDIAGGPDFLDVLTLGTPVVVTASSPATGGTDKTVTVFAGRVTSLKHTWDPTAGAPIVTVDTVDFTADLENTIVGDQPWLEQTLQTRFATIAELTTLTEWTIDETVAYTNISYRDVDAQGAMGLLSELASSVAGVLWSATSADGTMTRLYLEDPRNRPEPDEGTINGVYLSACDVLQDGVEWIQDVQDVITRAAVGWKEPLETGAGVLQDRTTNTIHKAREAQYGQRGISLSTQLTEKADAQEVGQELVARGAPGNWRMGGLTIDDALNDPRPSAGLAVNYVPDPSGEYDGITWSGSGTKPTRVSNTGQAHSGRYSYRFFQASPTIAVGIQVPKGATKVTVSAWYYNARPTSLTTTFQMRAGGSGAVTKTSPVYTATGVHRLYSVTTDVIADGTVYFYPVYGLTITDSNGSVAPTQEYLNVDDFGITFSFDGTDPDPVDFNGDTTDTAFQIYSWTATPGASPSVRLVRGSSEDYVNTLLAILDSNARNGLPIQLADLPNWTITGDTYLYLEGGSYTYTDGAWVLQLNVSKGPNVVRPTTTTWDDLDPITTWAQLNQSLTWAQMRGA